MNSVRRSLVQAAALGSTQVSKSLPHESSYRLPPLPSLRDLVRIYKLQAIKQLSQNFLLDEKLTSKIVKAAGNLRDHYVCEVGPGPGGITRPIIRRGAKKVVLIERDKRFASSLGMLKEACPAGMLDIYWGDVLSFDMSQMFPDEVRRSWEDITPPIHIIGNLPFSVSTPLIIKWLDAISERRNAWSYGRVPLTLTFQLEVAERLVAEVLNSQRSRLSIMAQHLCHCSHKFTIPGSAFVPKPDVEVGVVKFVPRKVPLIKQPFGLVEKVVRQTFSMRQKYCRRGISTLFPDMVRTHFTQEMIRKSEVDPLTRPYQLTMEDFSSLCNAYAELSASAELKLAIASAFAESELAIAELKLAIASAFAESELAIAEFKLQLLLDADAGTWMPFTMLIIPSVTIVHATICNACRTYNNVVLRKSIPYV